MLHANQWLELDQPLIGPILFQIPQERPEKHGWTGLTVPLRFNSMCRTLPFLLLSLLVAGCAQQTALEEPAERMRLA